MSSSVSVERHTRLSFRVNSASDTIPTSFSTAAGSLVLSGIALARGLIIVNETNSRIAINYKTGSTTGAPSSGQSNVDAYCPAAPSGTFSSVSIDNVDVSSTIYIKSDTGSTITSGLVYGWVW